MNDQTPIIPIYQKIGRVVAATLTGVGAGEILWRTISSICTFVQRRHSLWLAVLILGLAILAEVWARIAGIRLVSGGASVRVRRFSTTARLQVIGAMLWLGVTYLSVNPERLYVWPETLRVPEGDWTETYRVKIVNNTPDPKYAVYFRVAGDYQEFSWNDAEVAPYLPNPRFPMRVGDAVLYGDTMSLMVEEDGKRKAWLTKIHQLDSRTAAEFDIKIRPQKGDKTRKVLLSLVGESNTPDPLVERTK